MRLPLEPSNPSTPSQNIRPDHYLKIPFVWEPGCPIPALSSRLHFRPAPADWLTNALSQVLTHSLDPADQLAVAERGPHEAANALIALADPHFQQQPEWWQRADKPSGEPVGFVLCSLLTGTAGSPPDGTIFYLGVLPEHRRNGFGHQLLDQATRTLLNIGVRRICCDTALCNAPMVTLFRQAGYLERPPWERPLR